MANLRIVSVVVIDSINITATFTENLNENIGVSNVSLNSQTPGVPIPNVIEVDVVGNVLNIVVQPLTAQAAYFIIFSSSEDQIFTSINGDASLLNDGVSNQQLILGPIEPNNPIKQYITNYLANNVYNIQEPSNIAKYINGLTTSLSRALYDIGQTKNENYLSFTVIDEQQTRGAGPFDRLNEEGAYEVLRVGKNPTSDPLQNITQIQSFPSYPISLQSTGFAETLTTASTDKVATFNLETFTINTSKRFVIILDNIIFFYSSILSPYTYDISKYGYQLLNSEYDPDFAFTYLQLNDNQIRLNENVLNDSNFSLENIQSIQISYHFKDTGKDIDPTSLVVDTIISSGREVLPPVENIFALQNAPIVISTTSDMIGSIGSVVFADPNAYPGSNTAHPAFLYEITYRLDYMPSNPGEYSVDYNTGNIYVFGKDNNKDGTGAYPPVAIYNYRYIFKSEVDYVYDADTLNLVALPNGSLTTSLANVYYNYEQVLVNGIDYIGDVHIEVLSENIENNLISLNTIQPQNFPITDVFRIFNQTTGEIYSIIRWTANQIFFNYNKAPNIISDVGERASFQDVLNEVLFVSATAVISSSINLFTIFLNNNNIISNSQDCIGSSFNSSANFSNTNVFKQEVYFDDNLTISINNSRLNNIGDYQIDYTNGVIYCFVSKTQSFSIGTLTYKRGYIDPENPRIISVDDIYYRSNVLSQKTKQFNYTSFSNGSILPSNFDVSDEQFLMGNIELPYQILSGQVGTFQASATFIPGITNNINYIRGLYEYNDLLNNINPINFSSASTFNAKTISVLPLTFSEWHTVKYDGYNFYFFANTNLIYQSSNITTALKIERLTDLAILSGTIVLGSPFKIILSNSNSPVVGDSVLFTYSYTINDTSRIVVDYDKGGYYIDYTYLFDEIIISYEYGDNSLDFRQSNALNIGDTYYVSYKVGALRDALLKNFGTLINIPILNNLDVSFDRERYRDALMAAMQSFPQGPTVAAISNIVNTIVHSPPEIIESAFQNWSLGSSLLNPEPITTFGNFALLPAKYGNGVEVDTSGQIIKFPVAGNVRFEQGSVSGWIIPEWNGLDNQSDLIFTIYKNNIPLTAQNIFIGPAEIHPIIDGYCFTIKSENKIIGIPNQHKNGVFIYYTQDQSGQFNRWFINVVDGYQGGYSPKSYSIKINTTGKFYDVKSNLINQPSSDNIFSGTNSLTYTITNNTNINQGITFLADNQHYICDFGKDKNKNRLSIFKDESGYINFRIFDSNKKQYNISADVSSWLSSQQYFIAASWALNSKVGRDEMHLFIDGFEVPNIIKYGTKVLPYLHEKYRTVDPEEIVGVINSAIVSSIDMITTFGSNIVSSSINFSTIGIQNGNILYINEIGFNSSGYTITNVNGNTLTLNTTLPFTMTNVSYTVNKTSFDVITEVDLYSNITVSLLHSNISGNDLHTIATTNTISSPSTNFTNLNVLPGSLIRIVESGLENTYTILSVSGTSLIIDDTISTTYTNAPYFIYPNDPIEIPGQRALNPAYEISRDGYNNVVLTILNDAAPNDIVLINTLGLNNRSVNQEYYVWGNSSNIIKTMLSSPMVLNDVEIIHILLDGYNIGPSNSTLSGGIFTTGHITTNQPSVSDTGRTLSVYVAGDNVDYTTQVEVSINGTVNGVPNTTSNIMFNQDGTENTAVKFETVNYIIVSCKPVNITQNCIMVKISEANPITTAENSSTVPVIRYSYQVLMGNTLTGSGSVVSDINNFFSDNSIDAYLIISSPGSVAGTYQITNVSNDRLSADITPALPMSFTSGVYQALNTTTYSSGLQNGFFTFEIAGQPGVPYNLVQGGYNFNYMTYLSIPIEMNRSYGFVGTDIFGENILNGIVDEFRIVSEKLTDTRVGESALVNQETITKDFNSLVATTADKNVLMLLHFDEFPFVNSSESWITSSSQYIQSSVAVNDNFGKSIAITNEGLVIDNTGVFFPLQFSVDMWINTLYDSGNDPNNRYYFDATAMVSENVVSVNNATVVIKGNASDVLNVKVLVGDQGIDYFIGGKIINGNTLILNRSLPSQNCQVVANYVPAGVSGDRVSVYHDSSNYINFYIRASEIDYVIRTPIFWKQNSWHKIRAQATMNSGLGTDEMRFFVDGYECGNILYGNNILFGQNLSFGSSYSGPNRLNASIVFKDVVNEVFIGSDFSGVNTAYALINNLRISNVNRPIFMPFGEAIDINYSSNTGIVYPVVSDLYTTYLLNASTASIKPTFSTLKNPNVGISNFMINVFDIFNVLKDNPTSKKVMEELLGVLSPANSEFQIVYK